MYCEYCCYRNSWDCGDGWNRHQNCDSFKLDFDSLTDEQKERAHNAIRNILNDIIWDNLNKNSQDYGYW